MSAKQSPGIREKKSLKSIQKQHCRIFQGMVGYIHSGGVGTAKTWQRTVRTKKGSFSGKAGAEYELGDFQAGLEGMWRWPDNTEDRRENVYSHVSWYHSQYKEKKKCVLQDYKNLSYWCRQNTLKRSFINMHYLLRQTSSTVTPPPSLQHRN